MLTDIQNSFIDVLSDKFATKVHLNIPLHLKYVATLPCEIYDYYKFTTESSSERILKIGLHFGEQRTRICRQYYYVQQISLCHNYSTSACWLVATLTLRRTRLWNAMLLPQRREHGMVDCATVIYWRRNQGDRTVSVWLSMMCLIVGRYVDRRCSLGCDDLYTSSALTYT